MPTHTHDAATPGQSASLPGMPRRLRLRYLTGLSMIALLTLLGQYLIHGMLDEHIGTEHVLHTAGRQELLSQKITKAAIANDLSELTASLEEWEHAHDILVHGAKEIGSTHKMPDEIRALYTEMQPHFVAIRDAARDIIDNGADDHAQSLKIIEEHEHEFLKQMETIVLAHAADGRARITHLDYIEYALGGITFLVLLIEAVLIFEPLVRRLRRNWAALQSSEDRFRLAVAGSCDAIWDWDLKTDKLYLAPRFAEMIGVRPTDITDSPNELLGRISSQLLPAFNKEVARVIDDPKLTLDTEIRINHRDGSERWVLCRAAEHRDAEGHAIRLVGSLADITELKQTQTKLRDLAERDMLTGLANRKLFADRLDLCIARRHSRPAAAFGVMFLDFDRFKMVNDSLGHAVGDGLLCSFAARITAQLPEHALVARFGGDEFAVLLQGNSSYDILENARTLLATLTEPHTVQRHEIVSTASIGLVLSEQQYDSAETMLRDADIAMYEAKRAGRARLVVFDAAMHEVVAEQQRLERELVRDEVVDQLRLEYQPIIDIEDGTLSGFEALARWTHPTEGEVSPGKFIPIAEECGAIDRIGNWIFETAADRLAAWDRQFPDLALRMAVNVSRKQLLSPVFMGQLEDIAERHPELVSRLIIEITETAVVDDRVDLGPILAQIQERGYPIAMDDFGTGYSSLSCLHNYPLSYLKIDRSFVMNLEDRREFSAVFAAIVSLANALDLRVVAEGVETKEQLVQLQAMGCEFGQGYLFAKSLSVPDAERFIVDGLGDVGLGGWRRAA